MWNSPSLLCVWMVSKAEEVGAMMGRDSRYVRRRLGEECPFVVAVPGDHRNPGDFIGADELLGVIGEEDAVGAGHPS